MKKLSSLTVFFPFWNEEENIEKVVEAALPVAADVAEKWEILLIDDGSTDNTKKLGEKLEKKYQHVRLISHTINRGYGAALKTGFEDSQYDYIVFTDGDLQFDFSEITRLLEEIDSADMVIGFREKRQDTLSRHALMMLHRAWGYIFFGLYVKDIDCGFKLFKKQSLSEIMPLRSEGAMITTEILVKAKAKKLKIAQVGVTHYPRKHGEQSGANFSVVTRAVFESLILWWDLKNKRF